MSAQPIPFNDFQQQVAELRPEIEASIKRVLDRGWFILGPEVENFEQQFADYLEVPHVISVANGTDALQLALMTLEIQPGDEVICPALTAAPTALAIIAAGAQPVFADIDLHTFTLDPTRLEACLSEKTRAIMPVHLYGQAAEMPAIQVFADEHNLLVIEDAAQAHGATINGSKLGTLATLGCFSFYPTKNLGAYGDGGAVVTRDTKLATRLRQLRNLGQAGRFEHIRVGLNSRLDDLQAAILQVKLAHLEEYNAARRRLAERYMERLKDIPDLHLPVARSGYLHANHLFVIRHPQRDALQQILREQGIGSDVHYPLPLHHQPAFAHCRISADGLAISEQVVQEILSLPLYPQMSEQQGDVVADAIRRFSTSQ